MWLYVTESPREADRMLTSVLAPLLNRPADDLRGLGLLIGSAEECAERISAYARVGAQRLFVWPLADDLHQLEAFRHDVIPLVAA
jgi:alkanesulfonate monooxygenase SsuD/methylene tetrahydromethanopterin reductase-like flavin-dependent oxidoreductase (luciferase family)